jgi:hypothetical protein
METLKPQERTPSEASEDSAWVWMWGLPAICGSAALAGRLAWEETALTWKSGPQMLGFSLAHGIGAILFFFPLLLVVWVVVVAAQTLRYLIKRRATAKQVWAMLALAVSVLAFMELPYGFWQRLFVNRLIGGSHAGEFMYYAAVEGDLGTVRALVSRGVSVDSTSREGKTGLHAAAATGQMKILRYLVSRGANLNALDRFGDSPLEVAASRGQNEAEQFLTDRGAKRIRGDDTQRQRAVEEIVREDIQRMR